MSVFRSRRERRLWLLAAAVVVAIYSTLGFAGALAERLRESNLLAISFGLGFVLVLAVIAATALTRSPSRRELWTLVGVAAVYGMVIVRMGVSLEERSHLFEYGLVGVLIYQALAERRRQGGRVPAPAVLAVVATALLGWIDEGIQAVLPNRVYALWDVGVNALAGLLAVSASLALAWARGRAAGTPGPEAGS